MTTAKERRKASLERMNDPVLLHKIRVVIDTCDEALSRAAAQLQAAEALLSRYALYDDDLYQCSLQDIRKIYYSLAKVVAYRDTMDREEHIRRLAQGRLGAEINRLGDEFNPEVWIAEQRARAEARHMREKQSTAATVRALRRASG